MPSSWHIWIAISPMAPIPCTLTESPSLVSASCTACSATAESEMNSARSSRSSVGRTTSGYVAASDAATSRTVSSWCGVPVCTRSPTFTAVTSGATSTTSLTIS